MNMQPQRSYTTRHLEVYPAADESQSARQWYDADNNLICYATEYEVHEVARFFGYTPKQFDALRAKIQVGMINDHRHQMKGKAASAKTLLERDPEPAPAQKLTFKRALVTTLCLATGVAITLYFLA